MAINKKRGMDKIELNYIINEIQIVEKGFFRKAYKNGDLIKIKFNKGNLGIIKGKGAFLYDKEITTEENNFIKKIRSLLNNAYLDRIYLKDGDRYLVLEFNDYILIFELFAKGNIILCDNKLNILMDFNNKKGEKYNFKTEPFDFEYYLKNNPEKAIGSTLTRMLGKRYKDYILSKLGIKERILTGKLKEEEINKIKEEINKILAFGKPTMNKEREDFGLNLYEEEVESLSKAATLYYEKEIDFEEERRKRTIERIDETIKKYEEEERTISKKIEIIKRLSWVLEEISHKIVKNDLSEEDIRKYEKEYGIKIKDIDKKERTIIFDVKE